MIKLFCKFCNQPLVNFGVHDFDNSWYCGMKCFADQKNIDELNQPKDFSDEGEDYEQTL